MWSLLKASVGFEETKAKVVTPFTPLRTTAWDGQKEPRTYIRECSVKWGDGTGVLPDMNDATVMVTKQTDTIRLQEMNDAQQPAIVIRHMLQY